MIQKPPSALYGIIATLLNAQFEWKREDMGEERTGKDRRAEKERRKGGTSGYDGPEQRSEKYRRSDVDRRNKQQGD